ncbi:chitosanase [Streptomyces mashuensis]|uniref:Chitosanase n=1 Tax=Streptomyces mashuensis TaxID=33904 RepID=A0A919AUR1_9ACTN|nr:chitosanase [Streptomyces mashuensis]GHF27163.1 chitosanase [Streptomyces mashuensis]
MPPTAARRPKLPLPAAVALAVVLTLAGGGPALVAVGRAAHASQATPATGLDDPRKKDIAMRLLSSAENSSLDWRAQFAYIEDIKDSCGYTGGIIGFCSGTGDMLGVVELYTRRSPGNPLEPFLPALRKVKGSTSHAGLGPPFEEAWRRAARDPEFQQAQEDERDRLYFDPAVRIAKSDGLRALGQFAYFDAIVMHGPGVGAGSFRGLRATTLARARTPAEGGDERTYLRTFFDVRTQAMRAKHPHHDTSRVDTEQRVFLDEGNLDLEPPLRWRTHGDAYRIEE